MPEVNLFGEKLNVTSEMLEEYNALMKSTELARVAAEKALEAYDSCGNLDSAVKAFPSVRKELYLNIASIYLGILREAEVVGYDIAAEDLLDEVDAECSTINDVYYDLVAAYMKLQKDKVQAERYREMRKESRGRIIGGGFGIIGALEGMAIAGVVNTLTGAAHSLYNMADGAFSDSDISSKKREIYTAARDRVAKAVFEDVLGMFYFCSAKMGIKPFYFYENKGAQNIKKAIDHGEVPKERILREVAKVLYRMPYDDKLYFWAVGLVGENPKLWDELLEYAKLFDKEYVVQTKLLFLDDADTIYKLYIGNQFYKLFIKAPGMSFLDTARQMYEKVKVSSIYLQNSSEFGKHRDACLRYLRAYDYSFEDDENCFLIYQPTENFYIALTETHIYITNPKCIATLWQDIQAYKTTSKGLVFYIDDGRIISPSNEDVDIFADMFGILWLKRGGSLGVEDNTEKLNEQRERHAQFVGKIVKEMKELSTRLPSSNYLYYYGIGNEDKFRGAIAEYANLRKNEVPLICYDDTIFGGAEDGFLVTTKGIHLHNDGMTSEEFFSWSDLHTIKPSNDGTVIYLNDKKAYSRGISEKAQTFVAILHQLKSQYSSQQTTVKQQPQPTYDKKEASRLYNEAQGYAWSGEYLNAIEYYKKAADVGYAYALIEIAMIYYNGGDSSKQPVPENKTEACRWFVKAAQAGEPVGMLNAGRSYHYGRGVEKDYKEALKWLLKASEGGIEDKEIATEIGACYLRLNKDPEAFQWTLRGANAGNTVGMSNAGYLYMEGLGVKKDYNQAMYWYQKANDMEGIQKLQALIEKEKKKSEDDGCFVTSAVCESFHKPDDCYELTAFRSFRDDWLACQPDGDALIQEYYKIAPAIVRKINQCKNAKEIYKSIWEKYLSVCLEYIKSNDNARCKEKYVMMVEELRHKFNGS